MSKKSEQRQTTEQQLDPHSKEFVREMRNRARAGEEVALNTPGSFFIGPSDQSISEIIRPFMNPYIADVVGGVRGEFDHLRGAARVDANQGATAAGAFGSPRAALERGARLGELDRAQTSQIAGLLSTGFQNAVSQGLGYQEYQRNLRERAAREPLFRAQQAQQMLNLGLGPTGSVTTNTQVQKPSTFGQIAGLGLLAAAPFTGGATLGPGLSTISQGGPTMPTGSDLGIPAFQPTSTGFFFNRPPTLRPQDRPNLSLGGLS